MDKFSVIACLAVIGLFLLTCPVKAYVALNIDWTDHRLQLFRWKRGNELTMEDDNQNRSMGDDNQITSEGAEYSETDGAVLVGSKYNNEPADQREIHFKNEASDNQGAEEDNTKMSQTEERVSLNNEHGTEDVPLINEQQDNENEIDYGQHSSAMIILPSNSMQSRL